MKIIAIAGEFKQNILVKEHTDIFLACEDAGSAYISVQLNARGASCDVYGIIIGGKKNTYSINLLVHHKHPNTKSRVHIKSVLSDKSVLNFIGMIEIDKQAQLSDAYLRNDNLIIGDGAVVNTSPQLEINTDEVKVSHGVTIKTIDDRQEYYLRSRGLDYKKAKSLLVNGFINDIAQKTDRDEKVRSLLKSVYVK